MVRLEIQPAREGAPRPPLRVLDGGRSPSAAARKRRAKLVVVSEPLPA